MDDLVVLAVIASSGFFVALSFGLLLKYRQVSQKISASSDLGKDLWSALESRMKKQDERILDMMGRLEVVQSRFPDRTDMGRVLLPFPQPEPKPAAISVTAKGKVVTSGIPVTPSASQITTNITLDETEKSVIELLKERPRSSVEVKDLTGKTREHAARLMKGLFDAGFVTRDTSKKPFVYQLTEKGRSFLSAD
jgi:hypothetical protein